MAITVENQNILESDDKKKTTWTIEVISWHSWMRSMEMKLHNKVIHIRTVLNTLQWRTATPHDKTHTFQRIQNLVTTYTYHKTKLNK
jgi:cbb3-type cytochrome oxidase subunit 1